MSFAYKLYIGAIAWKIEHIKKGFGLLEIFIKGPRSSGMLWRCHDWPLALRIPFSTTSMIPSLASLAFQDTVGLHGLDCQT